MKPLAFLAALALAGAALAHSLLSQATPAPDTTVKHRPRPSNWYSRSR